jgi:hypothetical protein
VLLEQKKNKMKPNDLWPNDLWIVGGAGGAGAAQPI